jgi:hypothetical protein
MVVSRVFVVQWKRTLQSSPKRSFEAIEKVLRGLHPDPDPHPEHSPVPSSLQPRKHVGNKAPQVRKLPIVPKKINLSYTGIFLFF